MKKYAGRELGAIRQLLTGLLDVSVALKSGGSLQGH